MKKQNDLARDNILHLVIKYSIPAVVANLVNILYNIAGRYFIGKYAGEDALAGLTVAFPIMLFIISVAALIAIGGSTVVTIKLGGQKHNEANEAYGNLITLMVIVSVGIMVLGHLSLEKLFHVMGSPQEVVDEGMRYMNIILYGVFFQIVTFTFAILSRAEGRPNLAMLALVTSGLTNIIFDYIFIAHMGMGVEGAAWATIAAEFLAFAILVGYFFSGKSILKFYWKYLVLRWSNVKMTLLVGSSAFFSTIGTSLSVGVLNVLAMEHGGKAAVTALGAMAAVEMIAYMPVVGIQQGVQPIISYNYGAQLMDRTKLTLYYSTAIGVGYATIATIILLLTPDLILTLFLDKTSGTLPIAIHGLRMFVIGLPFVSIAIVGTAYLQGTVQAGKAFWLGMCRQVLFMIPLLFILPQFFGLTGVWAVVPGSDILATILAIIIIAPALIRERKKKV